MEVSTYINTMVKYSEELSVLADLDPDFNYIEAVKTFIELDKETPHENIL